MGPNTPDVAKTLCHMVPMDFCVIKEGVVSKSKFMLELHHLLTTRGKILKKALNDIVLGHHHHHPLLPSPVSCRSHDVATSYISPRPLRYYEFSCSNTPASKHNNSKGRRRRKPALFHPPPCTINSARGHAESSYCGGETASEASPLFGTAGRQVRIIDSPFQLVRETGDQEDCSNLVDREAERFIERFYMELRLQKLMAAREAAYGHYS